MGETALATARTTVPSTGTGAVTIIFANWITALLGIWNDVLFSSLQFRL